MTPSELEHLGKAIAGMFPKSDWTPELYALLGRQLTRVFLNRQQISAVVEQYRVTTRGRSPVIRDLIHRLKETAAQGFERPEAMDDSPEERERVAILRGDAMRARLATENALIAYDKKDGRGEQVVTLAEYRVRGNFPRVTQTQERMKATQAGKQAGRKEVA